MFRTCRPRLGGSDRGGVAVPVILCVAALIIIAVLAFVYVRLLPAGVPVSSSAGSADAPLSHRRISQPGQVPAPGSVAAAGPRVFTAADGERLHALQARVPELARELGKIGGQLQGARYAALNSNPDFKARQAKVEALRREVDSMIASLPERKQLEIERDRKSAARKELQGKIDDLKQRIAEARDAYAKARSEGTTPPVTESSLRQMLTDLAELEKDSKGLQDAIVSFAKELKKLELESRRTHPEISQKAAQAERMRSKLSADLMATKGVAELVAKRDAMQAERKAAVAELSELMSRSNRVAQAAGVANN